MNKKILKTFTYSREVAVLRAEELPRVGRNLKTTYTEAELGTDESLIKKCKNCDSNEFRYQYHKNKVENMISATEEINKKLAQMNSKNQRLCTVLVTLFKPHTTSTATAPGLTTMGAGLEDKDKQILDQINLLLGNSTRTSVPAEEDNVKNLLGNNMNLQLMAKLLANALEPSSQ